MALVTNEEVLAIMPEVDSTVDTTPYITTADLLVTDLLSDKGYSADRLKAIALWLSAHFVSVVYQKTSSEAVKAVSQVYQTKVDLNFNVTVYGQQALILDSSGTLAALQAQADGKRIMFQAKFDWLGTETTTTE